MIRSLLIATVVAIIGFLLGSIMWGGAAGLLSTVGLITQERATEVAPLFGLGGATLGLWRLR